MDNHTEKPAIPASGVSAAEKYAELEALGLERPRCECHGEPKNWARDGRKGQRGGRWKCSIKHKKVAYRYRADNIEKVHADNRTRYEANRDKEIERMASYRSDPDFRRRQTIYRLEHYHRRKRERWTNEGFTLGNDDEEGSACGDHAAA